MEQLPTVLPVLPIRNNVIFPSTTIPLVVGRKQSLAAIERALTVDGLLLVVAQKRLTAADPEPADLYRVGTLCKIESSMNGEDALRQVVAMGIVRFQISQIEREADGILTARGEVLADIPGNEPNQDQALFNNLKELSREILSCSLAARNPSSS